MTISNEVTLSDPPTWDQLLRVFCQQERKCKR